VSSRNGTFGFPQAIICLLRTCLAGESGDFADTDFSTTRLIKDCGRLSLILINPFVCHRNHTTTTLVGMVKLTALCGIGYWAWTKRTQHGKVAVGVDGSSREPDVVDVGKSFRASAPAGLGRCLVRIIPRPCNRSCRISGAKCFEERDRQGSKRALSTKAQWTSFANCSFLATFCFYDASHRLILPLQLGDLFLQGRDTGAYSHPCRLDHMLLKFINDS
jgi:hypothetical protein